MKTEKQRCFGCGLIGACYWNISRERFFCREGCEAAKKRGTPEEVVPEADEGSCKECGMDLEDNEIDDLDDTCYPCALDEARLRADKLEERLFELESLVAGSSALSGTSKCAKCDVLKVLPYRRDDLGGYVCLTCVERYLNETIGRALAAEAFVASTSKHFSDKCSEIAVLERRLAEIFKKEKP